LRRISDDYTSVYLVEYERQDSWCPRVAATVQPRLDQEQHREQKIRAELAEAGKQGDLPYQRK